MNCPICSKGSLKRGKIKEYMFGVYLGEFPADICNKCGESFTDSKTTAEIEQAAKKKGIDELKKYFGKAKAKTTYKEECKIREEVGKRLAEKFGVKLD